MPDTYRLLGGPGSPYSLKMRAILRYRHIPHVWLVPRGYLAADGELARAAKGIIPVLQYPDGGYRADSTPMAYDLEERHPGERSIIPDDPGQAFLSHLIEDMADEFLFQVVFDYRWNLPGDQQFCARRQMSGWLSPMAKKEFDGLVGRFIARQTANLAKMAEVDQGDTRVILQDFYLDILRSVETMQEKSLFIFGGRPSLADFGLYGQLSQCAIDPSASAVMREHAPRTFQWVQTIDDCSGVEGEWNPPEAPQPAVDALLDLAGRFYLPYLAANAHAVASGASRVEADIGGRTWRGRASPYRRNCLTWLRRELAALTPPVRRRLDLLLETHGLAAALAPCAAEDQDVPPMMPL